MFEIKPILSALMRSKAGALLLLLQITITVAIVSNAAFIINDRMTYLNQDTGFPEQEVFSLTINTFGEPDDYVTLLKQAQETVRAMPGVISATLASSVPLSGSGSATSLSNMPMSQSESADYRQVRTSYSSGDEAMLDSLGVALIQGRNFTPDEVVITDTPGIARAIITTKSFLDELFPGEEGLGKTVYVGNNAVTVVGVVEHMKGPWLRDSRPDNFSIIPFVEVGKFQRMIVRTSAEDRDRVMAEIENALLNQYSDWVIMGIRGMDTMKASYNAADLLMLRMLMAIIVILVLVTALGIFGMTLFNINKRTKQIGTRRALGARKSTIIRLFLIENGIICAGALVLGSICAFYLGDLLMQQYSVPALNWHYIVVTAGFVMLTSLVSAAIPANRAANISPSIATRTI